MELDFLIDIEFFSKFDQNAVDSIEVVTVVPSGGCKV